MRAVDRLREDPRERRLAGAARAGEEVGLAHLVRRDRVRQRPHDRLLPDDLVEGLRAVLPVEGGHRDDSSRDDGGRDAGGDPVVEPRPDAPARPASEDRDRPAGGHAPGPAGGHRHLSEARLPRPRPGRAGGRRAGAGARAARAARRLPAHPRRRLGARRRRPAGPALWRARSRSAARRWSSVEYRLAPEHPCPPAPTTARPPRSGARAAATAGLADRRRVRRRAPRRR